MNKVYKTRLYSKSIFLLLFLLLTTFSQNAIAQSSSDNDDQAIHNKRVTLNVHNKNIRHILNEIKKQTDIGFVIKDKDIEDELDNMGISVGNSTVARTLDFLLKGRGYAFRMVDGVINIYKVEVKYNKGEKVWVYGNVLDRKDRTPLIGAVVVIGDTGKGSITDANGNFSISVGIGDVLNISYTGYLSTTYTVTDKSKINIVLEHDLMSLDPVVVTGYGEVKASSYTGNAVTIKGDDLLKVSKQNVLKAIESYDRSVLCKIIYSVATLMLCLILICEEVVVSYKQPLSAMMVLHVATYQSRI